MLRPGLKALIPALTWMLFLSSSVPQVAPPADRLASLLKKAAEYCRRLDRAALDFVCLEEVTETSFHYTPSTTIRVYDYQFIRKNEETRERRDLMTVDGRKAAKKDVPADTVVFQFRYQNVLFGPVGLLSEDWQAFYDFELVGQAKVGGEWAVIVRATPKPDFTTPHCYGDLFISEDDGSVLKIVWDQRSLGNFGAIKEWAGEHAVEPAITAFSEYAFAKKGLRFPSRSFVQRAYVQSNGRKFVNAELTIAYRKYRFFTVETEVGN